MPRALPSTRTPIDRPVLNRRARGAIRGETLVALLVIGTIAAVVALAPPPASRLNAAVHDFSHVVVFALAGLAATRALWRESGGWPIALGAVIVLGAGLGYATEFAQSRLGGTLSPGDVGRDLLGALTGFAFAAVLRGPARIAWALAGVAGLVIGFVPLWQTWRDYGARDARFPVLFDPAVAASHAWTGSVSGEPLRIALLPEAWRATDGTLAAELRLEGGDYQGLQFDEPTPDWRGHETWCIDLVNPGDQPLRVTLRAEDVAAPQESERFSADVTLAPRTRERVRLPLRELHPPAPGRALDRATIRRAFVFHWGSAPGQRLYVGKTWLE